MSNFDIKKTNGSSRTQIKIELTGVDELIEKLNQIDKSFRNEAGRAIVTAGAEVINAQTQVNINETFSERNTGGLKNSVTTVADGSKPEARVEVRKVYARIQEYGGTIKPVRARLLHWVEDGQDIFARSVTLPARPYFRPAIESSESAVVKAMSDAATVYLMKQ